MGAFGRKRIEEELSWEYSKRKLVQAYGMLFPVGTEPQIALHGPAATGR